MNNRPLKTAIYQEARRNDLPYAEDQSIRYSGHSASLPSTRLNNSFAQLLDNDIYLEQQLNHVSSYNVGPKDTNDTEQIYLSDEGLKVWDVDEIGETGILKIQKKKDKSLQQSLAKVSGIKSAAYFIIYADGAYFAGTEDGLYCSRDGESFSIVGNVLKVKAAHNDSRRTIFAAADGIYQLYSEQEYDEAKKQQVVSYSLVKKNKTPLSECTAVFVRPDSAVIYVGTSQGAFYGRYVNDIDVQLDFDPIDMVDSRGKAADTQVNAFCKLDHNDKIVDSRNDIVAASQKGVFWLDRADTVSGKSALFAYPPQSVYFITQFQGEVYAGTETGLYAIDEDGNASFEPIVLDAIFCYAAVEDSLYLGSQNGTVYKYSPYGSIKISSIIVGNDADASAGNVTQLDYAVIQNIDQHSRDESRHGFIIGLAGSHVFGIDIETDFPKMIDGNDLFSLEIKTFAMSPENVFYGTANSRQNEISSIPSFSYQLTLSQYKTMLSKLYSADEAVDYIADDSSLASNGVLAQKNKIQDFKNGISTTAGLTDVTAFHKSKCPDYTYAYVNDGKLIVTTDQITNPTSTGLDAEMIASTPKNVYSAKGRKICYISHVGDGEYNVPGSNAVESLAADSKFVYYIADSQLSAAQESLRSVPTDVAYSNSGTIGTKSVKQIENVQDISATIALVGNTLSVIQWLSSDDIDEVISCNIIGANMPANAFDVRSYVAYNNSNVPVSAQAEVLLYSQDGLSTATIDLKEDGQIQFSGIEVDNAFDNVDMYDLVQFESNGNDYSVVGTSNGIIINGSSWQNIQSKDCTKSIVLPEIYNGVYVDISEATATVWQGSTQKVVVPGVNDVLFDDTLSDIYFGGSNGLSSIRITQEGSTTTFGTITYKNDIPTTSLVPKLSCEVISETTDVAGCQITANSLKFTVCDVVQVSKTKIYSSFSNQDLKTGTNTSSFKCASFFKTNSVDVFYYVDGTTLYIQSLASSAQLQTRTGVQSATVCYRLEYVQNDGNSTTVIVPYLVYQSGDKLYYIKINADDGKISSWNNTNIKKVYVDAASETQATVDDRTSMVFSAKSANNSATLNDPVIYTDDHKYRRIDISEVQGESSTEVKGYLSPFGHDVDNLLAYSANSMYVTKTKVFQYVTQTATAFAGKHPSWTAKQFTLTDNHILYCNVHNNVLSADVSNITNSNALSAKLQTDAGEIKSSAVVVQDCLAYYLSNSERDASSIKYVQKRDSLSRYYSRLNDSAPIILKDSDNTEFSVARLVPNDDIYSRLLDEGNVHDDMLFCTDRGLYYIDNNALTLIETSLSRHDDTVPSTGYSKLVESNGNVYAINETDVFQVNGTTVSHLSTFPSPLDGFWQMPDRSAYVKYQDGSLYEVVNAKAQRVQLADDVNVIAVRTANNGTQTYVVGDSGVWELNSSLNDRTIFPSPSLTKISLGQHNVEKLSYDTQHSCLKGIAKDTEHSNECGIISCTSSAYQYTKLSAEGQSSFSSAYFANEDASNGIVFAVNDSSLYRFADQISEAYTDGRVLRTEGANINGVSYVKGKNYINTAKGSFASITPMFGIQLNRITDDDSGLSGEAVADIQQASSVKYFIASDNGLYTLMNRGEELSDSIYKNSIDTESASMIKAYQLNGAQQTYAYSYLKDSNHAVVLTSSTGSRFESLIQVTSSGKAYDMCPLNTKEYFFACQNGLYRTRYSYALVDDLRQFSKEDAKHAYDSYLPTLTSKVSADVHQHIIDYHDPSSQPVTFIADNIADVHLDINEDDVNSYCKVASSSDEIKAQNDIVYQVLQGTEADGIVRVELSNFLAHDENAACSYIWMKYASGYNEVYVHVPTTNTYYINHVDGLPGCTNAAPILHKNIAVKYTKLSATFAGDVNEHCSKFSIFIDSALLSVDTFLGIQATGNSLPLKIYRDAATESLGDDAKAQLYFHSYMLPTKPLTQIADILPNSDGEYQFDFACFGTDAQSVKLSFYDTANRFGAKYVTIVFDPNGAGKTMPQQTIGVHQSRKLRPCTFKWPDEVHKTFAGWSQKKQADNTTPTYHDQEQISFTDKHGGEVIKLYAVWSTGDTSDDTTLIFDTTSDELFINDGTVLPNEVYHDNARIIYGE